MLRRRGGRTGRNPEELQRLLGLVKSSDTVELKLTVPESDQRSALLSLGMDPLDAEIRQVFFFDTPDLGLYEHGVVARTRRVQGKLGGSVVKLRPVVPDELPEKLRRLPSLGVEVDAMPGGYVCSASMKRKLDNAEVKEAATATDPSASCSPRSSARSSPRPPRTGSSSTTCLFSGRSSCSS